MSCINIGYCDSCNKFSPHEFIEGEQEGKCMDCKQEGDINDIQ